MILEGLAGKALLGVGGAVVGAAALKFLPKLVSKEIGKGLGAALTASTGDPERDKRVRKVILSLVELAEYELPDRGQGKARFEAVAKKAVEMFPLIFSSIGDAKLSAIIEEVVSSADEELKRINSAAQ